MSGGATSLAHATIARSILISMCVYVSSYEAAGDALELEVLGDLSVEEHLDEIAAGHQELGAQIDAV